MTGYAYGEPEPKERCPYCGTFCHADFVDVGVGMTQCGPYHCDACGASEIGAFDRERDLSPQEKETGWYAPGEPPSEHANIINGKHVPHTEMLAAYRAKFTGNPDWAIPGEVERWREAIRRGDPTR